MRRSRPTNNNPSRFSRKRSNLHFGLTTVISLSFFSGTLTKVLACRFRQNEGSFPNNGIEATKACGVFSS